MSTEPQSVHALLSALSMTLGQTVALTQGECWLEFEGDVEVGLSHAPQPDLLTVRAELFDAHSTPTPALLQAAMDLNYAHLPPGHQLARDAASGRIVLLAVLCPARVSCDEFVDTLAGFITLVPLLRTQLRQDVLAPVDPSLPDIMRA